MVQFAGRVARIGAIGTGGSPGASGVDQYGRARVFLLDPSSKPGNLPGEVSSNGNPLVLETSDVLAHELGHIASSWGLAAGSSEGVTKMTLVEFGIRIRQRALVTETKTT